MEEVYPLETVRNACHGYIGSPLKDEDGIVLGEGVRTRVNGRALVVTYRLNNEGVKRLQRTEVEIGVLRFQTNLGDCP